MNIHIIPHGRDMEHIKTGLRTYEAIDKVYLLTSENFLETSTNFKKYLEDFGYEVEIKIIDAFDLRSVVDTIMNIARRHKNDKIFINITGGTNLMAGAATSTAFFVGATAYYVMERRNNTEPIINLVKEIPIPTQPLYLEIKGLKRKILEALWEMENSLGESKIKSLQELCFRLGIYPQKINYHIRDLEKKNLVKTYKEGRTTRIEITPAGRLYLKWTT